MKRVSKELVPDCLIKVSSYLSKKSAVSMKGVMLNQTVEMDRFNDFFTAYKQWELKQAQKPLLQMESFFEAFKALNPTPQQQKQEKTHKIFPVSQYEGFYRQFTPLHQQEIYRGSEINVWQQAGLKHYEVRNTAVLAWWLDCYGTHALGNRLFTALLNALPTSNYLPNEEEATRYQVRTESLPLGDSESRIDVEIQGDDFLIFIEVKINAGEGEQQLHTYYKLLTEKADFYGLEKRALIYLTRSESPKAPKDCLCISWKSLTHAFETALIPQKNQFSQQLLHQFCHHIQSL